jgi:hypothetical protein
MRPTLTARAAGLLALAAAVRPAGAQLLAVPAAQTPFGGRPLAVALDVGAGGDRLRNYGLALGLRRGESRLTAALGLGVVQGFATTRNAFGLRVAYLQPLGGSGALAAAPFVGFGYVGQGDADKQTRSTNGRPLLPGNLTVIPAGVGLGYRRVVAGRAVTAHVSPQAQLWRVGPGAVPDAKAESKVYVRAAAGLDVAVTRQIGVTLAVEGGSASTVTGTGAAATGLAQGPRPVLLGAAVSYSLSRRRR